MTAYLVAIHYKGVNHYLVEGKTPEAAEKLARERYSSGDKGDFDGPEFEEIIQVITEKFDE